MSRSPLTVGRSASRTGLTDLRPTARRSPPGRRRAEGTEKDGDTEFVIPGDRVPSGPRICRRKVSRGSGDPLDSKGPALNRQNLIISSRAYGVCVILFALTALAVALVVPKTPSGNIVLQSLGSGFLLVAGALLQWRRFTAWAAAAVAAYFTLVMLVLTDGRVIVAHPTQFLPYESTAIHLAMMVGALIIWCRHATISDDTARRTTSAAQMAFGACALVFGTAHFVYLNLTAPIVPHWLPPSQTFWAYATGLAQIAACVAMITGFRARLAMVLLTIMYAAFTPLVHIPLIISDPSNGFHWVENGANILLTGSAWVLADSLRDNRSFGLSWFRRLCAV